MKDQNNTLCLFNNCHNGDHEFDYGPGAFFDLGTTGRHGNQATNLDVGQVCVVASTASHTHMTFKWYSFSHETLFEHASGLSRAFYGDLLAVETLSKSDAAKSECYSGFYNVKGKLKIGSFFRAAVPEKSRPQFITDYPDDVRVTSIEALLEGNLRRVVVNAHERNPIARAKCVEHYGAECVVCGFSFANTYGAIADGFIHVHHLIPLSEINTEYQADPIADLRPVCPNCHAVIHIGGATRSISDVKEMLAANSSVKSK